MTKEQYSGVSKRPAGVLSASRDTLNPLLNTNTLKNRLNAIEHYKYVHGVERAHWPHFALARFGRHVMRYKGNLAVKGFFAYLIYRDLAYRSQMHQTSFVTLQQEGYMIAQTAMHTGAFLGLCAMI